MKVTTALIDKCSELWLSAAMENGFGPAGHDTMRGVFLSEYLNAPTLKDAKKDKDFAAWKDAYNRFHKWMYGTLPPRETE